MNLNGAFYFSKEALKIMSKQRSGKIINISSIFGMVGAFLASGQGAEFGALGYSASKGAIINLTRELAIEYAKLGINVNAICPGFFVSGAGGYDSPEFVRMGLDFIPMGRISYPEEIKGLAIYLASSASEYLTGQIIAIDGGIVAK